MTFLLKIAIILAKAIRFVRDIYLKNVRIEVAYIQDTCIWDACISITDFEDA